MNKRTRSDGVRTLADLKGRCVIDSETGCWIWKGAKTVQHGRKCSPVTRVWLPGDALGTASETTTGQSAAWRLAGNKLPEGHVVWRSVCWRHDCINPKHCSAGTRRQMHQAIAAAGIFRRRPQRILANKKNTALMMTPVSVVREAEAMFAAGALQKDVRAKFGMAAETAKRIRLGTHQNSTGRQRTVANASIFSLAMASR